MASALKNQMKTLSKELFDLIDAQEEQIAQLKKGLHDLLKEEEVMDLPSYGLLRTTYMAYLSGSSSGSSSGTSSSSSSGPNPGSKTKDTEIYDPLYAPPKTRRKALAASKAKVSAKPRVPEETPPAHPVDQDDDAPSGRPDFGVSLLEDMDPSRPKPAAPKPVAPKPAPSAKPVAPTAPVVKVPEGKSVYKVEIQGKQYLRFEGGLYNIDTYQKEGSVTNAGFTIGKNTEAIEHRADPLRPLPDSEYYVSSDRTIYIHVCEDIYHGVGVLTEDDQVGLWN